MTRDELRTHLDGKNIIRPEEEWPQVQKGQYLVMDEWGSSFELITGEPSRSWAVEKWAEMIEKHGGYSGGEYPKNDTVYVIDHKGKVQRYMLETEWDPSFIATRMDADDEEETAHVAV